MIGKMFDAVFGCRHSQYSFPMTMKRGAWRSAAAGATTSTYVVCMECGRELPYDWQSMKVVSADEMASGRVAALATKEAA